MKFNCISLILIYFRVCSGENLLAENPDEKQLYDYLLSNYDRFKIPVANDTDALIVRLGLKLSQLMDVNIINEAITTKLWVVKKWFDYRLQWNPKDYGGLEMLYVPSEHIWVPNIALFNIKDGNSNVSMMTEAMLKYTGEVNWKPPAIFKSSCKINMDYFPFDEQTCLLNFGAWVFYGAQVDLRHMDQSPGNSFVHGGVDLSEFHPSYGWDIVDVRTTRSEEYYPWSSEPFSDITFKMKLRRTTLFYMVNFIIPCGGFTYLIIKGSKYIVEFIVIMMTIVVILL